MPQYEVAFSNDEHTCNSTGLSVPQLISPSTANTGSEIISFESNPATIHPGTVSTNVALQHNLISEGLSFFEVPPSPSGLFYATTDASAYDGCDFFSNLDQKQATRTYGARILLCFYIVVCYVVLVGLVTEGHEDCRTQCLHQVQINAPTGQKLDWILCYRRQLDA